MCPESLLSLLLGIWKNSPLAVFVLPILSYGSPDAKADGVFSQSVFCSNLTKLIKGGLSTIISKPENSDLTSVLPNRAYDFLQKVLVARFLSIRFGPVDSRDLHTSRYSLEYC